MDMKTQQYIRDLDSLKSIINKVEDDEVKSLLVKLFCVRTAGLLEVFIKTRISEYSRGRVPQEINRFLTAKFKDITSLKSKKLEEVLRLFSNDWADSFEAYLIDHDQKKTSLDSMIAQRHSIAHGQPSSISASIMSQYYDDVKDIVCHLDTIIR